MAGNPQSAMFEVLDRMWTRFLPQIQQRIDTLDAAAQAVAAGTLSEELRQEAHAEAHKLAGVLGTFGLTGGTDLARELETHYAQPSDPDSELAAGLVRTAAQLRTIVAARK
jgi:HPt (histidine-containing phosphotransfer) domain-containing protein